MLSEGGCLGMIVGATLGVQIVLLLLTFMSLWSWTIIVFKLIVYRRAKGQVLRGSAQFTDAEDLLGGLQGAGRDEDSPLARVGTLGLASLRRLERADLAPERKRMLAELGEVETELVSFAGAFLNRVEREVSWAPDASQGL